jgi:hypothetical protein
MTIYDEIKFQKYTGKPVRVKNMCLNIVAIAEGAILASFSSYNELRQYFPYGNYEVIK